MALVSYVSSFPVVLKLPLLIQSFIQTIHHIQMNHSNATILLISNQGNNLVQEYHGNNDLFFEKKIERYGCFDYYVEWSDRNKKIVKKGTLGTFQINPVLTIGGRELQPDGIVLQTMLTKCIGTIDQWESHIKSAAHLGYNMIHYTPVQELGASGSCYSIYDQLTIARSIFANNPELSGTGAAADETRYQQLGDIIDLAERQHGVLGMIDLVWNHTANNSPWLAEHPEAGYTIENSPHLKPAAVLDDALEEFSANNQGLHVDSLELLETVLGRISEEVITPLKLWQYYVLDVAKEMDIFRTTYQPPNATDDYTPPFIALSPKIANESQHLVASIIKNGLIRDATYERFSMHVNLDYTYDLLNNTASFKMLTAEERLAKYEDYLRLVNLTLYREYDADVEAIQSNIRERIKYERVSSHGPHLGPITNVRPLLSSYFTKVRSPVTGGIVHLANNGWIYNYNPSVDFASKDSKAYFRRDVIIWGDCVKMRYGSAPADNPWLWQHMKSYTERMARIFHAIRIDNCHSTPIHVAQYLLDAARAVRPFIYVTCELFTGSEEADSVFVKRLGINSLIREAMQCHDSWELGRVCHRYGGKPIGSFQSTISSDDNDYQHNINQMNPTSQPYNVKSLKPTLPPALFMDCTHDNPTPMQKRTITDTLPNTAVVAMAVSAIGSTRGYDEIYPSTIDLVNETRTYQQLTEQHLKGSLFPVKQLLNKLHIELANDKYTEVHIHQEHNVIMIQRYSPSLNKSIFLVAHTAFEIAKHDNDNNNGNGNNGNGNVYQLPNVIQVPCKITDFIVGANITNTYQEHWSRSEKLLTGVHIDVDIRYGDRIFEKYCYIESDYNLHHNANLKYVKFNLSILIKLKEFPPGSILVFRGEVPQECTQARDMLLNIVADSKRLYETMDKVSLIDMNILLFRHNHEEQSVGGGGYNIPNYGMLPFCGLQSFASLMERVSEWNDLSHPICGNVRDGDWAMDYIVQRLISSSRPALQEFARWLADCFTLVKRLPRHFIPKYFHVVIMTAYRAATAKALSLMSPFITTVAAPSSVAPHHHHHGHHADYDFKHSSGWFARALALASIQFYGIVTPLISNSQVTNQFGPDGSASLAAGLPHFCQGYMRAWGRDTFIALRGLMLTTGRYQESKQLLVGFGSALRFGLIPNLLDSGTRPRYNSRDSVWWWIKAVQDYCEMITAVNTATGSGSRHDHIRELLETKVYRLFPNDPNQPYSTVHDLLQEVLQAHATGIHFREPHAGREIDDRMRDEGFNVDIDLNLATGFLYGGNLANCGTWMDKMGESHRAHNYGDPATPRDGAPIEITAMLYSTLQWLTTLNNSGLFRHDTVSTKDGNVLTFRNWAELIRTNFEKHYYIPSSSEDKKHVINISFVRRRYVYKDTVGSKNQYSDYQFRPNQLVAMSFAPELFTRDHVLKTLDITTQYLVGPLGIKTLDPNDTDYHPNYENSADSDYRPTARGFNYHNGPEWIWLYGFYLESLIKFNHLQPSSPSQQSLSPSPAPSPIISVSSSSTHVAMTHLVESLLLKHKDFISQSPYVSLPELTNHNGSPCKDSCDSQAWSIGTLLAALQTLWITAQQHYHHI
uniref:Glycogen debranching enzyme n=1 Tax=Cavenderia deminutiva TaxID=361123 RepID=A0A1L2FV01_9MYCE|nr:glycogen debranching enzyme/amylo-alpha-1,6-glucosidase [Cavenderia deminutiva]